MQGPPLWKLTVQQRCDVCEIDVLQTEHRRYGVGLSV